MSQCQSIFNLARIINRYLEDVTMGQKFIIKFRLSANQDESESMYQRLQQFKALCNHSTKLQINLVFEANIPSIDYMIRFWSEPVSFIELPTSIFVANAQNRPVLSRPH